MESLLSSLRGRDSDRHVALAHASLCSLYRRQGQSAESVRAARAARVAADRVPVPDVAAASCPCCPTAGTRREHRASSVCRTGRSPGR